MCVIMKRCIILLLCLSPFVANANKLAMYMTPDIGSPGTSVYVEIVMHTDSLNCILHSDTSEVLFVTNGGDAFLNIRPIDNIYAKKIQISSIAISWQERLLTAHIFISPSLRKDLEKHCPNPYLRWRWDNGLKIALGLYRNNELIDTLNFYVVEPYHFGDISSNPNSVLGEGTLGMRSPRGAMLVDSVVFGDRTYTVSTNDCDPNTSGNQGYLPFTLTVLGNIKSSYSGGKRTSIISVDAKEQDGGVGGGGGGGAWYDSKILDFLSATDSARLRGGNGYTGGGPGGVNAVIKVLFSSYFGNAGGGIGTGGVYDNNNTWNIITGDWVYVGSDNQNVYCGGRSLNGVVGACRGWQSWNSYEAAGGGTGHPFGSSGFAGLGQSNNTYPGGYGGGSGGKDKETGGDGVYADLNDATTKTRDGRKVGNSMLVPLAGGSGGASGNPNLSASDIFGPSTMLAGYGGGGGGAIAINAKSIELHKVSANGAAGLTGGIAGGNGSGGGIIITARDGITLDSLDARGGGGSLQNAGRTRSDCYLNAGTFISTAATTYGGLSINTIDTIIRNKDTEIDVCVGPAPYTYIMLWIKTESDDMWSSQPYEERNATAYHEKFTIPSTYWEGKTDSVYYIFAVKAVDANPQDDTSRYTNTPKWILSQAAAQVLYVREEMDTKVECENFPIDTLTFCGDTTIHNIIVQKIWNTGDIRFSFEPGRYETKKVFGNSQCSVHIGNSDNNEWYIEPGDTAYVTVNYQIPANITSGIYRDTISLWHTDTTRPIPWKIPVTLYIHKPHIEVLDLETNLSELNIGEVILYGQQKEFSLILKNDCRLDLPYHCKVNSNRLCYTFKDSIGIVPAYRSVAVLVQYQYKDDSTIPGIINDTIKVLSANCEDADGNFVVIGFLSDTTMETYHFYPDTVNVKKCDEVLIPVDAFLNTLEDDIIIDPTSIYNSDSVHFRYVALDTVVIKGDSLNIRIFGRGADSPYGIYSCDITVYATIKNSIKRYLFVYHCYINVLPSLTIIPQNKDFGTILVSDSANAKVIIRTSDTTFNGIHCDTAYFTNNTGVFTYTPQLVKGQLFSKNMPLELTITAKPTMVGNYNDTLVIKLDTAGCNEEYRIPLHITSIGATPSENEEILLDGITKCDTMLVKKSYFQNFRLNMDTLLGWNIESGTINPYIEFWIANDITFAPLIPPSKIDNATNFTACVKVTTDKNIASGDYSTTIFVRCKLLNGDTLTIRYDIKVVVIEGVTFSATSIDFGDIYDFNETSKDIVVSGNVKNNHPELDTCVYLKDGSKFKIVKNVCNDDFNWDQSETCKVMVDVPYGFVGYITDTLEVVVKYPLCYDTIFVPISANVIPRNFDSVSVQIIVSKHVKQKPDKMNFPITLSLIADKNIKELVVDSIEISLLESLFHPNYAKDVYQNKQINIEVNPYFVDSNRILARNITINNIVKGDTIEFVKYYGDLLLGEKDTTAITVSKIVSTIKNSDDISYTDSVVNGGLSIDICREGGDRLLQINDDEAGVYVYNPVINNMLTVDCNTLEIGNNWLEVIDILGVNRQKLKEWSKNIAELNKETFNFDVSKLETGLYFIRLHTPSQVLTDKFVIVK